MDYEQARAFIKETLKYGSVYGLTGIRGLMERLGNVQEQLSVIHVAGTNGKGSVCAMLASILQAAGYRTGVYASPAVFEPEEIIRINGAMISRKQFTALTETVQAACTDMQKEGMMHPTAFEVETAIAFCYFYKEHCDYVVLETGLGGALDATNLITHPLCSIITAVSMDHMALLGQTLEEIAAAKAGIIKSGCPCVSSEQQPEVAEVLGKKAAETGSRLWFSDSSGIRSFRNDSFQNDSFQNDSFRNDSFQNESFQDSCFQDSQKSGGSWFVTEHLQGRLALAGACQKENLACVLTAVDLLREQGVQISQDALLEGLAHVRLPGRFEKIASAPDVYIDGAHNEGAARCLRQTVRECFAGRRVICVIGVFADKEYKKLLELMASQAERIITVTPRHPRALDGAQLARAAEKLHPAVSYVPDLAQAAQLAQAAAGRDGVVLAFGSFSYLGDFKAAVLGQRQETDVTVQLV